MESGSLGHFKLLEKIGEGGMGRVYKARDTRLDRFVAIKVLPESRLGDPDRRARFTQEAKAASALNHPNIITIHEIGEQDGQTFIVMELVDGKPLNELIARKGMRLTEALRIAVQAADALTAAHAAGIVHRDLKPGNIMVDAHGRVKVLDFGLAKLTARAAAAAAAADDSTRTVAMDRAVTEEGVILGSLPYMSPEQAEGKPVDARSDIFSFGAVLYEMVTGQRAFRGESRVSTLAAVVEKEPQPPSEIATTTPPELERLIARCLRKDVLRRSQHMADVKLALEELRDESESGKLPSPAAGAPFQRVARGWLWPSLAMLFFLIAAAALAWSYLGHRGMKTTEGPELVRLSPDDGHSYDSPAISPDGRLVAYVSDRGGNRDLWLQQVGGAAPIQLTHSNANVSYPAFFPDATRILYATLSKDRLRGTIEVIPTLGGEPRVLSNVGRSLDPVLSPDGSQIVYYDASSSATRLMMMSSNGGEPREVTSWPGTQGRSTLNGFCWASDSRHLIVLGSKRTEATSIDEWEWFALPVDGSKAVPTGVGDAVRSAGLRITDPAVMTGDRVLFGAGKSELESVWEIRLSPGSWRVQGAPRQLTFGAVSEFPNSISSAGLMALDVQSGGNDYYMIPISPGTGQPAGAARRLTQDGRWKFGGKNGGPASLYFSVGAGARTASHDVYDLDLESARQTLLLSGVPLNVVSAVSHDGRQIAYSIPEGNSYSIRVGATGAGMDAARLLCRDCGMALRFSADGRFILRLPEATVKPNASQKFTVHLMDMATGKDRPWLEHPSESIMGVTPFGDDHAWLGVQVAPPGSIGSTRGYIAPWREDTVRAEEWIEVKSAESPKFSPSGNFIYFVRDSEFMAMRFDPRARRLGEPFPLRFVPGSPVTLRPEDSFFVRSPGLVFSRNQTTNSTWLMKLPRE